MILIFQRARALLVIASVAAAAQGQTPAPTSGPPFTVEEAVRLAVTHNPTLAASASDIRAAAMGVSAAQALANPELTVTPGFSPGGSDTELLLRQPLEINGVRAARTGIAAAQLRRTQAEAVTALRDLVFTTKSTYYELARTRALSDIAKDLVATAEELDRITQRQVEVGTRPGVERIQTGIEVARAHQQAAQAESRVTIAQAALNTVMGRAATAAIDPLEPLPATTVAMDEDVLLRQALGNRAEITSSIAAADVLRQQARQERAEGRPDLAPQFRVGAITRGVRDSGFGIGVTLPIVDLGGRRGRVRQAEEAARAQDLRTEAVRNQIRQEVAQAMARYQVADAVVKAYPHVLEQARRLLDASRTGFQSGQTGILAVLEAQRTYRTVQTEYTGALVDHALALAEVERAAGTVSSTLQPISQEERKTR